jgi:hypothetical protein
MKYLSVFADESGNFDLGKPHSPHYILSLVLHDQSVDITPDILKLNDKTNHLRLSDSCVHAGPLIRREREYSDMSVSDRIRIFNTFYNFTRAVDIKYHTVVVDKKNIKNKAGLISQISKRMSQFLKEHLEMLTHYDRIIVYYDNGQSEISKTKPSQTLKKHFSYPQKSLKRIIF